MRLLQSSGVERSQLTVFDKDASRSTWMDPETLLRDFAPRTLVISPGVPLDQPWIHEARNNGVQITSELSLACACLEKEEILAITGSLGKSTVVSLLGVAASCVDPHAFVGGNLGIPLATYAHDVLEGRTRASILVLELSSYQLENAAGLRAHASGITYLAPNHLDRYESCDAYYAAKWRLVSELTHGPVVLNRHGGDLNQWAQEHPIVQDILWVEAEHCGLDEDDFQRAQLVGAHNRDNLALAYEMAFALEWPEADVRKALLSFKGLPHRVENVGTFGSIRFVNDSKATALESVKAAVDALSPSESNELWLLLGGRDKGLPWNTLKELKQRPQLRFAFFGEAGAHIQIQSALEGPCFPNLRACMEGLRASIPEGSTVLLSPGGSSLDEFRNFEERGQAFASWAEELYS